MPRLSERMRIVIAVVVVVIAAAWIVFAVAEGVRRGSENPCYVGPAHPDSPCPSPST